LILNRQATSDAIHLISGLDLPDFGDLGRRSGLGIYIGDAAGELEWTPFLKQPVNP
jgi:hypothetical protein